MRLKRIDVFRLFAIYMVVWAHTQFFDGIKAESSMEKGLELGVDLIVRASMQFFFIASGYFLGGRIFENPSQKFATAWKYSKKLLLFFVFWCAIYGIENPQYFMRLVTKDPVTLIFEGTRIHLWFLVALFLVHLVICIVAFEQKGQLFPGLWGNCLHPWITGRLVPDHPCWIEPRFQYPQRHFLQRAVLCHRRSHLRKKAASQPGIGMGVISGRVCAVFIRSIFSMGKLVGSPHPP
jgi:hypothetical protein